MAIGIIAEFNPLHKGHEYILKRAGEYGPVVCVLSGNFVQRGDTALAEKRTRALAALNCGADVVLELPVLWSMSTAQNFALGGISALKYAGCDKVIFGSECGDIEKLCKAADILASDEFSEKLAKRLKSGVTFASARQSAGEDCGVYPGILAGANDNLAIEYIAAAKKLNYSPEFIAVKRMGAPHDFTKVSKDAEFASASLLRKKLLEGDFDFCKRYMSEKAFDITVSEPFSDITRLEKAILAVLRSRTIDELSVLPDLSEGVENKLFSAVRLATSLTQLYNTLKVKRYTLARIRRLVLSAFIGADNSFFMKPLNYLRVLGFGGAGEKYIKEKLSLSPVPVITRTADFKKLDKRDYSVFETECRATDLYMLSLPAVQKCGLEYTTKIIKTEC